MNDNENENTRLAKAAMRSLRVVAPESLTADLKRLARTRKSAASIWDGLREALAGGAWAYGAGAAFAAAAIGIFILRAVPEREPATGGPFPTASGRGTSSPYGSVVAQRPARIAAAPQALQDLWSDDDGGDNDEI